MRRRRLVRVVGTAMGSFILLAWLAYWYLPRPLLGDGPWTVADVWLWTGVEEEKLTQGVDGEKLVRLLERYKGKPAFYGDYFPYYLDEIPLRIHIRGSRGEPATIYIGEHRSMYVYHISNYTMRILDSQALWEEVFPLLPRGPAEPQR